jgi:hypothetical protein
MGFGARSGLTGAQAAREILDNAGLTNMPIEEIPGHLTDHFHPIKKALFLSSENYHGRSLSAVGVAAHESGHALQQQAAYSMFNFRMMMSPVTGFATYSWAWIALIGFLTPALYPLVNIAIGLLAFVTLFQLVTLPVEYDASRRAKQQLVKLGIVQPDEAPAINKVLDAAALTYVAALLVSFLELLKLIMIANGNRRRN